MKFRHTFGNDQFFYGISDCFDHSPIIIQNISQRRFFYKDLVRRIKTMTEKRCTELIPAAAYARFSSERQHETSIEAQIAAIQDFSRQNGYKIIATYIDRAKSGTRLTPVDTPSEVTEESLRSMIAMFSDKIKSRNISDCKRFIQDFVDSVIVFQDKVEVNLKIPASSSSLIIRRTVSRQFLPTVKGHQNTP